MICHWCCLRKATTELDGEMSCLDCASPVPEPGPTPTYSMRVYRAVKFNPGSTCIEIANVLGVSDSEKQAVNAQLYRLVKSGSIEVHGYANGRGYYATGPAPVRTFTTYPDDVYDVRPEPLPIHERKEDGCACGVGLLPEWNGQCPECRDYEAKLVNPTAARSRHAAYARRRRERLKQEGLCMENPAHGPWVRVGRCAACLAKFSRSHHAKRNRKEAA